MDIKDIKVTYFLGIGGIGMSAIARYFKHSEIEVIGYDRTNTPLQKHSRRKACSSIILMMWLL